MAGREQERRMAAPTPSPASRPRADGDRRLSRNPARHRGAARSSRRLARRRTGSRGDFRLRQPAGTGGPGTGDRRESGSRAGKFPEYEHGTGWRTELMDLVRISHRRSLRGRRDAAVTGGTDRKTAKA